MPNYQAIDLKIGQQIDGGFVADQSGLGNTGLMVTTNNLAKATDWQTAFNLADACTEGGYNDWRLPSWHELHLIYDNLYLNKFGDFQQGEYWSSTPGYDPGVHRAQTFSSEDQSLLWVDGMQNHVRAVRTLPWVFPSMDNLVEISNDLFKNAEETFLRYDGNNYLSVDSTGIIWTNSNRANAVPIITEVFEGKLYLKMKDQYLANWSTGMLKANGASREQATPFKFYSSSDNGVVIKTASGSPLMVSEDGHVTSSMATHYISSIRFDINLKPTVDPHRIMHTQSVQSSCDAAKSRLVWMATGGLILGMGVGPYLNGGRAEAGVYGLLNSTAAGKAAIDAFIKTISENPKATATAACGLLSKLYKAGKLMDLVWILLPLAGWAAAGQVIRQAIMWAFVPELEVTEFFTNLTVWTAQTTQAVVNMKSACASSPKGVQHPKFSGNADTGSINIYRQLANEGETRLIDGNGTPSLGHGWNDSIKSFYINKGHWAFYKDENYQGTMYGLFPPGAWGGAGTVTQFNQDLIETTALRCIPETGITLFNKADLHGTMIHLDGDQEFDLTSSDINFTGLDGSISAPDSNWHLVVKIKKSNSKFSGPVTEFIVEIKKAEFYSNLRNLIPEYGESLLRLKRA